MVNSLQKLDNLRGCACFLRVDFNVPLTKDGKISDDSRIRATLPTLQYLIDKSTRIAVASHLGRPKGVNPSLSLRPLATHLGKLLGREVRFIDDCVGPKVTTAMGSLDEGGLLLLENTRFHPGEESNDPKFSAELAKGFTLYINDAFGTLHRAHASTVGMVAHCEQKAMGLLVADELRNLQPLRDHPKAPFVLIMGGAKVADKLGLIENFLPKLKGGGKLLIGGGMVYTFLKAAGQEVGQSLVDLSKLTLVGELFKTASKLDVELVLPIDFWVENVKDKTRPSNPVKTINVDQAGLDIGPESVRRFSDKLRGVSTIFWNGPLGVFERPEFAKGTLGVAKAVAGSGAKVIIGGGDTLAAFGQLHLIEKVSHASTGGGATLEYLEGIELPGLKALEN